MCLHGCMFVYFSVCPCLCLYGRVPGCACLCAGFWSMCVWVYMFVCTCEYTCFSALVFVPLCAYTSLCALLCQYLCILCMCACSCALLCEKWRWEWRAIVSGTWKTCRGQWEELIFHLSLMLPVVSSPLLGAGGPPHTLWTYPSLISANGIRSRPPSSVCVWADWQPAPCRQTEVY